MWNLVGSTFMIMLPFWLLWHLVIWGFTKILEAFRYGTMSA